MNKKATVDLIKKIAEDLDFFPGTAPAAATRPTAHRPAPAAGLPDFDAPAARPVGGGTASAVPQVKKMQQSLIDLAQSVSSQINIQDMASGGQQEAGEASSRDSFNNFVTKHFMGASDVPGTEFDPDASKTQMDQKSPSAPHRMLTVMNTMSRIGNPKTGEMAVDGKWGPRTNAALRNAYAFAFAMLQLASSFQTTPKSYSQADLAQFKQLIPPDEAVTPVAKLDANTIQAAGALAQHLRAIQGMYAEIKQNVLQNPQYQTYIEGNTPLASYKKTGPAFNPQEKQMYDQLVSGNTQYNKTFNFLVHSPDGKASMEGHISIADLMSADAFKKWYYSPNNAVREDPTLIFNAIRQALQQSNQVGAA